MNKSLRTIIRLNLKYITGAYIALAAGLAVLGSSHITNFIAMRQGVYMGGNIGISIGWAVWALPVAAAIAIGARHFRRIHSLGGKRKDFFQGSLATYMLLAVVSSLAGLAVYYIEHYFVARSVVYEGLYYVPDAFGWGAHGPAVFFLQQFAFLFLTATFTHTFVAAQGKWYGWAAFIGALVVLCVFLPIEPLRNIVAGYAWLVMFNPAAPLQIAACLVFGLGFYLLNKPILMRKTI